MVKHFTRFLLISTVILSLVASSLQLWISPGNANAERVEKASAPTTDLVVDAIEVTQSMQDLNNSVPLVGGKQTYVRVYVHSTNGTHPTTATLTATSGGYSKTILPIKPGGPFINVRPTYNRLMPSHAFLFELPLAATFFNQLTLTAQVNPDLRWHPRDPEEFSYANNSISKTVSFDPVPKLHLVIADQPYTFNNITYYVRPYDRWRVMDWIYRVYPLSQVKFYFRTLPPIQAQRKLDDNNNWNLIYPDCNWLNLYLAKNRASIFGSPIIPSNSTFLAIVPDDIGFMRGCAPLGGWITNNGYSRVASGPAGDGNWGWDFDGSYTDWYSGHEVGHAWGRPHVRGGPGYIEDGCGGEAKAVIHNQNGSISPTLDYQNPAAIFGFDSLHLIQGINPILGPNWSDVMTYCDYQWMSKTTYVKLKEAFENYLPQEIEQAQNPFLVQDVMGIFGSLDPSNNDVAMQPVFTFSNETPVSPPEPGSYAIVLYEAGGNELARYPFTPNGLENGPAPFINAENEVAYISLLLPYTPGIASLEVEGPRSVLYHVDAGLILPAVQVLFPNGGEVFGEESITVNWTASDEDGDPLTFNVDYSADNGNSWEPVAQYVTGSQVTIDQVNLPGSDMALFRVSASDGLHTSTDTSDGLFFIPNHRPTGEIIAPTTDLTVASDQTVSRIGNVYDYDLGTLDGENLEWWSDRDGLLATGSILSTASLSLGLHEVNLVADDGQGQQVIGQVIVTVVDTPNDLPPQPDALVAGPDLVFLQPNLGISNATIYLDNLNLGNPLAWNVSSSEPWVQLSASSGVAPQDITVSTSLTGRDFGEHKALLTFSDPGGLYAPVYIVVVVTIPEYNQFLPLAQR